MRKVMLVHVAFLRGAAIQFPREKRGFQRVLIKMSRGKTHSTNRAGTTMRREKSLTQNLLNAKIVGTLSWRITRSRVSRF